MKKVSIEFLAPIKSINCKSNDNKEIGKIFLGEFTKNCPEWIIKECHVSDVSTVTKLMTIRRSVEVIKFIDDSESISNITNWMHGNGYEREIVIDYKKSRPSIKLRDGNGHNQRVFIGQYLMMEDTGKFYKITEKQLNRQYEG